MIWRVLVCSLVALGTFLGMFGLASPVDAQQPASPRRIAVLPQLMNSGEAEQFRRGLREAGYLEGRDVLIDWHVAPGDTDRLPALVADLVRSKVDVIVVTTTFAAQAAKRATSTIPIVIATSADPVGAGLVENLAHPGGNITGFFIDGNRSSCQTAGTAQGGNPIGRPSGSPLESEYAFSPGSSRKAQGGGALYGHSIAVCKRTGGRGARSRVRDHRRSACSSAVRAPGSALHSPYSQHHLSWPFAVQQLRLADPTATWEVKRFDNLPYLKTETGYFVEVAVTVQGITLSQIHPVLDDEHRPIAAPTCFDINTSIQRALVKAIALHGLGLCVYAGEDLPKTEKTAPSQAMRHPQSSVSQLPDSRPASASQVRFIRRLIEETGSDLAKVLDYFNVRALEELTSRAASRAIKSLQQNKRAA